MKLEYTCVVIEYFFVYLHSQLVLVTEINRESGENPEQSRCCVRMFSGKQMSLSR